MKFWRYFGYLLAVKKREVIFYKNFRRVPKSTVYYKTVSTISFNDRAVPAIIKLGKYHVGFINT